MADFYRHITVFVAICLVLLGLLFWWEWRSKRKEEREHSEALTALAGSLRGRVVGRAEARAWSAELRSPMKHHTEGFFGWLGTVRRPRFETALDFRQGNWSVRVSEASMRKATTTSAATFYEHRIEVATSILPAIKISRRVHVDFRGRPLSAKLAQATQPAGEAPLTVVREQREWLRATLPEPVDREFAVFTTDPAAVARAFTPQVVEWMVGQARSNPFFGAMPLVLTLEAGLVYATAHGRIDPDGILPEVDVILGLLDRMGVTPAHPPVMA